MAIAGGSISAEPITAASARQPKLILADLPEAPSTSRSLPILARLPDCGMRPPLRAAQSASFESAVRRWFGQRTALAILVGSGLLMAALAIAPFVGQSERAEPRAPQPVWEPISEQQTRHPPVAPPFETNAAMPSAAAAGPGSHLNAPGGTRPSDSGLITTPRSAPAAASRDSALPIVPGGGLTRLPPIERSQPTPNPPDARRPITVEQLFAASAVSTAVNTSSKQRNANIATEAANGPNTFSGDGNLWPNDRAAFSRKPSAATPGVGGGPAPPLVDRRLSPPPLESNSPTEEQMIASAAEAAAPGTAQLEGVIETPSLRANYDPSHSQRY